MSESAVIQELENENRSLKNENRSLKNALQKQGASAEKIAAAGVSESTVKIVDGVQLSPRDGVEDVHSFSLCVYALVTAVCCSLR